MSYDDSGRRKIAALDLRGRIEPLVDNVGSVTVGRPYTSGDMSVADNGRVAYTQGEPTRPADVAVVGPDGEARQLTRLNEDALGYKDLGEVESVSWRSPQGDYDIDGWMVKPPAFDPKKQYPLILQFTADSRCAAYGPHSRRRCGLRRGGGIMVLPMYRE
ncbi:MAG: hypothetical protein U5O39_02280 [Gammaproteobacteria bacterium]|nr:hypothetical protein [Gammaproteobacteria bacterium]